MGFWVGAYETFGGYASRQRGFFYIALIIGGGTTVFLKYRFRVHMALLVGFCVILFSVYFVGDAIGQTFYVRPTGWKDTLHTFYLGLSGRL